MANKYFTSLFGNNVIHKADTMFANSSILRYYAVRLVNRFCHHEGS